MDAAAKRCHDDPMFMGRLENTRRLDEVDPTEYCAVFCTGGHGTLWDFPANDALQTLIRTIYENGGVVAAVCHGSGGLLNVRLSNGEYLIAGRSVTGFSNREETLSLVKKEVPFLLEDAMKRRGAAYRKAALPYTSHAVVDGRLVTGQNPQSTKAVAARVVQLLNDPGNRRQAKG